MDENRSILITVHRTLLEMDQRPQNKERNIKSYRRESNQEPWTFWNKDKDFLNKTPLAQILKTTIKKWNFIKLKNLYMAKDPIIQIQKHHTEWKKMFTNSFRYIVFLIFLRVISFCFFCSIPIYYFIMFYFYPLETSFFSNKRQTVGGLDRKEGGNALGIVKGGENIKYIMWEKIYKS